MVKTVDKIFFENKKIKIHLTQTVDSIDAIFPVL